MQPPEPPKGIREVYGSLLDENPKHLQILRPVSDGSYADVSKKHLSAIDCKAGVAQTARAVQELCEDDKLQVGIRIKDEANAFFRNGDYDKAMDTYVRALACLDTDFTSEHAQLSIDQLMVPVLCNLAACALKKQAWRKAVQFSEEVLKQRPGCVKAWMQCGAGHLGDDEFSNARRCFNQALEHNQAAQDDGLKREILSSLRKVAQREAAVREQQQVQQAKLKTLFSDPTNSLYSDRPSPEKKGDKFLFSVVSVVAVAALALVVWQVLLLARPVNVQD